MRRAPHALAIAALVAAWAACAAAVAVNYQPYADGSISTTPTINSSSTGTQAIVAPGSAAYFAFNASTISRLIRSAGPFDPDAGQVLTVVFSTPFTLAGSPTINVYWVKDGTYDEISNVAPTGTADILIYRASYYGGSGTTSIPLDLPFRYASARGASNNGVFVIKVSTISPNSQVNLNTREHSTPAVSVVTPDLTFQTLFTTCEACLGVNAGMIPPNVYSSRSPFLPLTMAWCASTGKCLDAMSEVGASYGGSCANIVYDACPSSNGLPPTFNTIYAQTAYVYNFSSDGLPELDTNPDLSATTMLAAAKMTTSPPVFSNMYFLIDTVAGGGIHPNASVFRLGVHGLEQYQCSELYTVSLLYNAAQFSTPMTWDSKPKMDGGFIPVNLRSQSNAAGYRIGASYIDLGAFAKYTSNPTLLLQLNMTQQQYAAVPQYFFYSASAKLKCLQPRLFVGSTPPDGSDGRPNQRPTTCANCLFSCQNALGACGWCDSLALCIDGGTLPPANCQGANDWHTTSCPLQDATFMTYTKAISDYSLYTVSGINEQYYLPLWTASSNLYNEVSIIYFRVSIAGIDNRVSQATVSISRGVYLPHTYPDNILHGIFWLDIPDNTTLQELSFDTKQNSPKYLVRGVNQGSINLQPTKAYCLDVTTIVKKGRARGQSFLWFAMDSNDVENWIDDTDPFYKLAHPRVDIVYGNPANYSLYDGSCSKCFTQCPSLTLNCGYCFDTNRCLEGDELGPFNDIQCLVGWAFRSCPIGMTSAQDTLVTTPVSDAVHVLRSENATNFASCTFLYLGIEYDYMSNPLYDASAIYLRFNASTLRNLNVAQASLYLYSYTGQTWGYGTKGYYAPLGTAFEMTDNVNWDPKSITWGSPPLFTKRYSSVFVGTSSSNVDIYVVQNSYTTASAQISYIQIDVKSAIARALGNPLSQDMVSLALTPMDGIVLFQSLAQNSMPQLKPQVVITTSSPVAQCAASTCADCLLLKDCGWCDSTSTCMLGGTGGPVQTCRAGVLAWFFDTCPLNYFTQQPYLHRTFVRAAADGTFNSTTGQPINVITRVTSYNIPPVFQPVTVNPSVSRPPGFTNPQDLCISGPDLLRAGAVWDLTPLSLTPFAVSNITNVTFIMRASQTVPSPAFFNPDYTNRNNVNWDLVDVNTTGFDPATPEAFTQWPTGAAVLTNIATPLDANGVWMKQGYWSRDVTSYILPKIQSGQITSSMGLAVSSGNMVTWLGSSLNNFNRAKQTLLITVNVSLDIPTDCPTLLDPCACILKPGCGWCSLSSTVGYCLSGAAAGVCSAGAYSTGPNTTVPAELSRYLTPCAPGTIGPYGAYAEGLTNAMCSCTKCLAGTYGTGTTCYPCPAGSYSQDGAAECTLCAPGTYQPAAGTNGCLDCPSPGVDCSQSGLTYPGQLLPGYSGCCLAKIDVRPCAEPTACPGGPCNCTVGFCTPGYVGDYCENCETAPQPYHRVSPGVCVPCPNLAPLLIVVAAVFIFLLCVFLLRYGRTVAQYLTSLSIGLAFTQAVGLLKIFNFKLPPEMSVYIDIISVTNLSPDLFSAECAIPGMSYYTSFAVRILMPVGVGFVFMMIYLSVVIHSKIVQRCAPGFRVDHKELVRPRDNALKGCAKMKESCRWQFVRFTTMTKTPLEISNFKGRVINAFITFLVLTYLYTSQTALSVFACEPNSAGTAYRIIGDGAVLCSGPQYTALKTAAYIALAVYTAGLPILFLGILLANRAQAQLADEKFLSRYGMLFSRYKPGRFYWELIIMMRKLLIVVCAVFSRVVRPTYATALIVVFGFLLTIVAQVVGRPFKYGQHNFLEGALLILYTLTVIAGASSVEGNIYVGSYAMLIFCNIGVLLMLITLIYDLVRRCRRVVNKSDRVTNVLSCCGGVFGDQDNMSTRTDGSEMSQFDSSRTRTNFESGRTNDFDSAKFPSGKSNFNSGRSNLPAPPPPAAAAAAPAAATAPPVTADEPNPAYEAPPSYATSNAQTNANANAANAASGRNYRSGKTPGGAPNPFLPSPAGTPNRNNPFLDVPEAGSDPTDQFASGKNRFLPKTPGGTPPAGSPAPAAAWNTAPPASTAVDWNRPHEARESAMPGADLTASGRQWNQAPPPSVAPGRVSATAAAPPMPDRPSRTATPSATARGSNSPAPAMPPRPKG